MKKIIQFALIAVLPVILTGGCATTGSQVSDEDKMVYMLEIAFGSELGSGKEEIKKWTTDARIQLIGNPTSRDERTVHEVVEKINSMIGPVQLSVVEDNPSISLYFVSESEYAEYEPNFVPGSKGFFWVNSRSCEIYKASILISTSTMTNRARTHLIWRQLANVLGLMQDSPRYKDSIFYDEWNYKSEYAPIDEAIIKLLYSPDIQPCMNRTDVMMRLMLAG